jgi:large subunit ribosomal protein L25
MSDLFEVTAEVREDMGKGASRRLRRLAGQIPAIIYGGDKDPIPLTLNSKDLEKSLTNEAFYSHVLTVKVGKSKEKAILKDLQRHPAKNTVTHADFMRVDDKVLLKVHVPIHFLNEDNCHGVKTEGGIIQHQTTDIEVQCLPGDIPAFIEVDMLTVPIGQIIHLSDIALPKGVTSVALTLGESHDLAVASVIASKATDDIDEVTEDEAEGDETEAEEGESED